MPDSRQTREGGGAEEVLRPIVDGITSQVGEQFFRALVRHLAAALKVRFAFISEQLDHDGARVRLVAFWAGDDYGENFEYPTTGTPCEHVVGKGLASFPAGLRELFPEDAWLREVGAESYLAIPLLDSTERPLGHLGVMHDEPMCEEHLNEQILRIFAGRAGGELERNRTEVALRESEERYRALVETSPDGISLTDLEGRVLFCNKQALVLLGFESMQEVLGRNAFDLIAPEDRQRAVDHAQGTLKMKSLSHVEYTLVRKDGSRFPAELGASLVVDAEGKPKGFIGVVRDITERKRAEEALRRSEERYRELVEDINDVIYEVDTSGRVTYISPMAEEVSGYSPNEIVGHTFAEFIPPEEVPARMDRFREAIEGWPIPTEFSLVSKSGEILWIHTSPRVIREGDRITGFRGVMTDITAHKRAEEALRESEQQYRALYDDNPTMYFTVDTEGTVLSVNRFGAEQLGYNADELIGRPVLGVFHDEDREAVQEQLAACVRNPGEVAQWEFRKLRKDGSLLWVKETVRAVSGPDGDTIVLIVCEDITERKRVEEALQEAREELEIRVETQLQRGNTYGLTFRELTVIHLVAAGKSDKEIGALLSISPRTANKHVQNILTKMGASSRTEAGVRAVREGLVD